jgi:hypothetical protein
MVSEYALLAAISWFYLAEHMKLSADEVASISLRRGNVVSVHLPSNKLMILGKYLYLVCPLNLFEARIFGKFGPKIRSIRAIEVLLISRYVRLIEPLMWVELVSILFYFVYIPFIILVFSINVAVISFLFFHLVVWIYSSISIYVIMNRKAFRGKCKVCIAIEMLVSPGLMAAVRRRLEHYLSSELDVIYCEYGDVLSDRKMRLCEQVEARMMNLVEYEEVTEDQAAEYTKKVRDMYVRG